MDRAEKQVSIETLKGVFADAGAVVVTHYMGLTVAEMTDLRLRLRKEGASLKVVKNTLVQKALDGAIGEAGDALFTGPVAIAYAPDPVSAAKVVTQYAKDNDSARNRTCCRYADGSSHAQQFDMERSDHLLRVQPGRGYVGGPGDIHKPIETRGLRRFSWLRRRHRGHELQ